MNNRIRKKRNKQAAKKLRNSTPFAHSCNDSRTLNEIAKSFYLTIFMDILFRSCKVSYLYKRNVMRAFKSFHKKQCSFKVPTFRYQRFAHGFKPGECHIKPTLQPIIIHEPDFVEGYHPMTAMETRAKIMRGGLENEQKDSEETSSKMYGDQNSWSNI